MDVKKNFRWFFWKTQLILIKMQSSEKDFSWLLPIKIFSVGHKSDNLQICLLCNFISFKIQA